jgi:hypothetical protein
VGDQRVIARACNLLGSALMADGRAGEAACLHIEATQAAHPRALSQATDALMAIGPTLAYGSHQPSLLLAEEASGSPASTFAHLGQRKAACDARTNDEDPADDSRGSLFTWSRQRQPSTSRQRVRGPP